MRPLYVALREVVVFFRDKGDLAFSLLLPVVVFALMYGAMGSDNPFHATAYVVNEDEGAAGTVLVESIAALDTLSVTLLARDDARERLERSDIRLAVWIPGGFSAALAGGETAEIVFQTRGNGGQSGQITAGLVRTAAGEMVREYQVRNKVNAALRGFDIDAARMDEVLLDFMGPEGTPPVVAVTEVTVGDRPDPVGDFLPGILTMFVLFATTLSARALVEERRNGTLERLLTTRLSVGELFYGKFLAITARGVVQTLVLLVLACIVFQLLTPLAFLEAVVVAVVFAAAVSALGLVIGAVSHSEDQATWTAVFFTMVMVILAGTFFEISEGTVWETFSRFSVNTYANDAYQTIIGGGSLTELGLELGVLAAVAAVGLIASRLLFKALAEGK